MRALGAGHLLDDPRLGENPGNARLPDNFGWLTRELERIFAHRPRAGWVQVLEGADVPVAPVLGADDWLDHHQITAMGLRTEVRNDADRRSLRRRAPW